MNTTKLLKLIVQMADRNNIEITNVKLYPEAIDVNNKVKVCIIQDNYMVHRVNEGGGQRCWAVSEMLDKVLELLKPTFNKGDYITDGEQSGILIRVEEGSYHILNLKNSETIYYHPSSLKELEDMGWEKGE